MPNEQKNYASVQHEKLQLNEEGCFLANNKSKVIYITKESNSNKYYFYFVTETPYTKVNIKLLSAGHFDEALSKINDNVPSTDSSKEAIIEQFYLDCAWNCIRLNQYDKAYQYCHLTNFDPFEFCYLFQTILELPILHQDKEQEIKNGRNKNQISTFYKMYIIKTNVTQCKEIDIKTNKNELVIINNILHEQNEKKLYIKNKLRDILMKVCSTYINEVNGLENNNIKEYALNMLLLHKQQQQQQQQQQSKSKSNGILKHSNSGNNYKPNATGSYTKHVYSSNNNVNTRKPKKHSLKDKSKTKYKSFYHNSISSNK
jgi:hypothetical protein